MIEHRDFPLQIAQTALVQGGQLACIRAIAMYGLRLRLNRFGFEVFQRSTDDVQGEASVDNFRRLQVLSNSCERRHVKN
jgi:hypothetical protein